MSEDNAMPMRIRPEPNCWFTPLVSNNQPSTEQLLDLQRRLGVPVEFDASGWLSGSIEIRMFCNRVECELIPRAVRVSSDSPVAELAASGGVVRRCEEFNQAIRDLRALRCRFDVVAQEHGPAAERDLEFHACHQALRHSQTTALCRLENVAGRDVITLAALDSEIKNAVRSLRFYQGVLERVVRSGASSIAPQVTLVERWDEDTFDCTDDDEAETCRR